MTEPRILPKPPEKRDPTGANFFATLRHNAALSQVWRPLARYFVAEGTLPPKIRELVILRTAFLCESEYGWGQHLSFARSAGLTDVQINRVRLGPAAHGWTPIEAASVRVVDELQAESRIAEATWKVLAEYFDEAQLVELIVLAGHYVMLAYALNSLGIEREDGVPGWEAPTTALEH